MSESHFSVLFHRILLSQLLSAVTVAVSWDKVTYTRITEMFSNLLFLKELRPLLGALLTLRRRGLEPPRTNVHKHLKLEVDPKSGFIVQVKSLDLRNKS